MDSDYINTKLPLTLRLPFYILSKFGIFPTSLIKRNVPMYLLVMLVVSQVVTNILQFTNIEKDVSTIVENFEGIIAFSQSIGKITIVLFNTEDFVKLAHKTERFWRVEGCTEKLKNTMDTLSRWIILTQKIFLFNAIFTITLSGLAPLVGKSVPYGTWTLEGHPLFHHLTIFVQIIISAPITVFVTTTDCLFLGFCTEIIIQFRLLCGHIQETTVDGNDINAIERCYLNEIKYCIRHNLLMLKFLHSFQKTFSGILLTEYISVGPLACMEVFAIFESKPYDPRVVKHILFFLGLLIQLGFYCFPANYVKDEASAVANAVYSSNWYTNYFPSLKIPLLLMMQNAQRQITFKAGGIVTFDARTVVNVLKVAWSTCSVIRELKRN